MLLVLEPKFNFSFLFVLLSCHTVFCQTKAVAGVSVAGFSAHDFRMLLGNIN